ncbi:MAG TPA: hypothetical protein VF461_14875 [Gemmatimonadaceae bacterium]
MADPVKQSAWCSQQEVLDQLPRTMKHEGYTPDPRSHVQTTYRTYTSTLVFSLEKLVSNGYPTVPALMNIRTFADSAAITLNAPIDDPQTGAYPIPCLLKTF